MSLLSDELKQKLGIENDDEVAQCIFQTNPGSGVRIDHFGEGVNLQIGVTIFSCQTFESGNAVVIRGVVHNDEFVVTDESADA